MEHALTAVCKMFERGNSMDSLIVGQLRANGEQIVLLVNSGLLWDGIKTE